MHQFSVTEYSFRVIFVTMCPHLSDCPLFGRFTLQSTLRLWQIKYCEGEFRRCARYQLTLAGNPVPELLLPNGQNLRPRSGG
jgi:hypothetical protein